MEVENNSVRQINSKKSKKKEVDQEMKIAVSFPFDGFCWSVKTSVFSDNIQLIVYEVVCYCYELKRHKISHLQSAVENLLLIILILKYNLGKLLKFADFITYINNNQFSITSSNPPFLISSKLFPNSS